MAVSLLLTEPPRSVEALTGKVLERLRALRVVFGVDAAALRNAAAAGAVGVEVVVARGQPVIHGEHGEVEILVQPPSMQPRRSLDGEVHLQDIDNLTQVSAGEVLSRRLPGFPGTAGRDVHGVVLYPQIQAEGRHPSGLNTTVSGDGLEMKAVIDGHVVWMDDRLDVVERFLVDGDLDYRVGNVRYHGSVEIRGSIRPGFCVVAGGDVRVVGSVEKGDIASQRGSVEVIGSVLGEESERSRVHARREVIVGGARFAHIESDEGSVTIRGLAEHCLIKAAGDLTVVGQEARFSLLDIGGAVRVERRVHQRTEDRHNWPAEAERRRYVRIVLLPELELEVSGQRFKGSLHGTGRDMSAGGMKIAVAADLVDHEPVDLKFRTPDKKSVFWISTRVVRRIHTSSVGARAYGQLYAVEFRDLSDSVRDAIARYCIAEDLRQRQAIREKDASP